MPLAPKVLVPPVIVPPVLKFPDVMFAVAPVKVNVFVNMFNLVFVAFPLIEKIAPLATVTATFDVTVADAFEMVRFLKFAAFVLIACAVVPLKSTVLPVVVVVPALGV